MSGNVLVSTHLLKSRANGGAKMSPESLMIFAGMASVPVAFLTFRSFMTLRASVSVIWEKVKFSLFVSFKMFVTLGCS